VTSRAVKRLSVRVPAWLSAGDRRRIVLAGAVFASTVVVLLPIARSADQHPDEAQYGWSAAYFGSLVAHGDFSSNGSDLFVDPAWNPFSYWSSTTGMGARFWFSGALALTGSEAPARPYSYTNEKLQGPETLLSSSALLVLRVAAIVAAALGLGLMTRRLGLPAALGTSIFLVLPNVREDLARAWAEGPLLLGFGMIVASYGSRFFAVACATAATFKLTAIGLWPLVLLRRANGGLRAWKAVALLLVAWTVLTPQSWWVLGPPDLLVMITARANEFSGQSDAAGGFFLPSRYLWPLELAACIGLSLALDRLAQGRFRWHVGSRRLQKQQV
jgi:hypothetical protein